MPRIKVEQTEPKTPTPVLAEAIVNIGAAAKSLHASGLNEDAIVTLLAAKTPGVGKTDVKAVLWGLRQLEAWYCRK